MIERPQAAQRPQYTMAFLAGSFGLSAANARSILVAAGNDRLKAAEMARLHNVANR